MVQPTDFQPPTAVIQDCQAWRETDDNPSQAVLKAASGARLSLEEVESLGQISDAVTRWASKVVRKFGGSSRASSTTPPRDDPPVQGNGSRRLTIKTRIVKMDEDEHLVFGWMSVLTEKGEPVVDGQGDVIPVDVYEKAAYRFVLESREGGEMHERGGVSRLVESMMFTKAKQEALGIDLGMEGHFAGWHVDDEEVWKAVKKGDYPAFSIEGVANRVEV